MRRRIMEPEKTQKSDNRCHQLTEGRQNHLKERRKDQAPLVDSRTDSQIDVPKG